MGNYVSCTLLAIGNQQRGSKVILPDNSIRQIDGSSTAAELMLDAPGYFIVNSRSMEVGRRFSPLTADEELEMGNVYVMIPMSRANSLISASDAGRLLMAANKAVRRVTGGTARVLPDSTFGLAEPRLKLDEVVGGSDLAQFKHRLSVCRSKRPMLETIVEESVCSR